MFTQRPVNSCRLALVIGKCGRDVTKAMFLRGVQGSTPPNHIPYPWTVDHFLTHNRREIERTRFGKTNACKFFPANGNPAILEEWDVIMFCFVLKLCNLPAERLIDIEEIRTIRNRISHIGQHDIPDDEYEDIFKKSTRIIRTFTGIINNPELSEETESFIRRVETLQMADVTEEETTILERLEHWIIPVEQLISAANEEFRMTLVHIHMRFEENDISTRIKISFTVRIDAGENTRAEGAFRSIQEGRAGGSNYRTIILTINRIREDIRQLGAEVEGLEAGSILFKLTSFSITSLIHLVDYFLGPTIERRLKVIEDALKETVDEAVKLQIVIPLDTQQDVMKKLDEQFTAEPEAKRRKVYGKVFNDPIHGQIELHPLCLKIVDTSQFQRLRYIKQLDICYLVYPGASHNRFEHSIGACYLAGKLLRALKDRQPELDITSKDILCVEIAALCHDLGQGPFSHVFERKFLPAVNRNSDWKHETAAVEMFDYMLQDNDKLHQHFRQLMPGFEDRDLQFIKEMIGVPASISSDDWPYKGRYKAKSFLYEIVANGENGIDVDKWDYLARDSLMLGMKTNFDHDRCIHNARVLMADGRRQICYRDKSAQDLYDMFYTRMTLHRRAYQHKTHNIIGTMICDALRAANEKFIILGKNGAKRRLSDIIGDMKAYTEVTDDILQEIMRTADKDLQSSRDIIRNIRQRKLYKCITQTQVDLKKRNWIEREAVQENLFNKIKQRGFIDLELEDVIEIDVVSVDYGRKEEDPVSKVWFYRKGEEDEAIRISKDQVSYVLPDTFAEQYIRVYSKITDSQLFEAIEESFSEWCTENNIAQPKGR